LKWIFGRNANEDVRKKRGMGASPAITKPYDKKINPPVYNYQAKVGTADRKKKGRFQQIRFVAWGEHVTLRGRSAHTGKEAVPRGKEGSKQLQLEKSPGG